MNTITGLMALLGFVLSSPAFIELEIPDSYATVGIGDELFFLLNHSGLKPGAEALFSVKDSQGRSYLETTATLNATAGGVYFSHVTVPPTLEPGTYTLAAKIPGTSLEAGAGFLVSKTATEEQVTVMNSLFDIIVTIPNLYREVAPGSELLASVKLINVGSKGRLDVFLDYWILNDKDEKILSKRETVAVETQANFVRTFDIPENAAAGMHRLYARVTYGDGKIADSDFSFHVTGGKSRGMLIVIAGTALAVLLLAGALFSSREKIEEMKIRRRVRSIIRRR